MTDEQIRKLSVPEIDNLIERLDDELDRRVILDDLGPEPGDVAPDGSGEVTNA